MNFENTCTCVSIRMLEQYEGVVTSARHGTQSTRHVRNALYINFELDRTLRTLKSSLHVHVYVFECQNNRKE